MGFFNDLLVYKMGLFNEIFNDSSDTVSSRQSTITNINGEVVVNGKHYKGKNVTVINGDVYIDGVKQDNAVETSDKEIKSKYMGHAVTSRVPGVFVLKEIPAILIHPGRCM